VKSVRTAYLDHLFIFSESHLPVLGGLHHVYKLAA
jgi:hypothetical protein